MIKLSNVSKKFGPFVAVNDLSFSVDSGEVLGFLGPNGAGKSTTMKMITGFLAPSAGTIEVGGFDVVSDSLEAKRLIGYLPEGAPCYGDMTVMDFLKFIAQVRGFNVKQAQDKLDRVIAALELEKVLYRPVETLSKGFNRRVGLAQAILHDPTILILDEPTDGLDPNQKHQVRELIRQLSKEKIVIISTHILEEVSAVCSRAMIIGNGQLLVDGTPAELAAKSRFHGAVTLHLEQATTAHQVLVGLEGVKEVEVVDDQGLRMTVFPKSEASIYQPVLEVIRQQQWQVKELQLETGRFDEVFRSVTGG